MIDKDKKLILEFCGFTWHEKNEYVHGYLMHGGSWSDGHWDYKGKCWYGEEKMQRFGEMPDRDLNFYFEYAVPKLNHTAIRDTNRYEGEWQKVFTVELKLPASKPVEAIDKDPAEAFGQALLKLIKGDRMKYQIIYADPPWKYYSDRPCFLEDPITHNRGGASSKYPTLSIGDIKKLPVAEITDKSCILFLWATLPKLYEALAVIEAWNFTYKTVAFTWVKRNRNSLGWFWGMGRWTRANVELCLLATKGSPSRANADVHQVIDAPMMRHSRKPDEIARDRIIRLCGDLPRIELFARRKVDGWDCWGNEVESDIEL